jgi:hypothetical protein
MSDHGVRDEYECALCKKKYAESYGNAPTDYESDPSAWTPELFDKIEEAGLISRFTSYVIGKRYHNIEGRVFTEIEAWEVIRSTPTQKSAALAKAIEEVCDE